MHLGLLPLLAISLLTHKLHKMNLYQLTPAKSLTKQWPFRPLLEEISEPKFHNYTRLTMDNITHPPITVMRLKLQFSLRHRSNANGTFFLKPTRSHFLNIYQIIRVATYHS